MRYTAGGRIGYAALAVLGALGLGLATSAGGAVVERSAGAFMVEHDVFLPVPPDTAYKVMTGDISGWWDHTMAEEPYSIFIDPRPGGGFWEYFDRSGDGALHGTVIYAHRGKRLRFRGPLGLSGYAIDLVVTYEFNEESGGTRVKVTCRGAGEMEEGWAEMVDGVWHHFLVEQLVPYVESGTYLEKMEEKRLTAPQGR